MLSPSGQKEKKPNQGEAGLRRSLHMITAGPSSGSVSKALSAGPFAHCAAMSAPGIGGP
jgi:hypothetical protein